MLWSSQKRLFFTLFWLFILCNKRFKVPVCHDASKTKEFSSGQGLNRLWCFYKEKFISLSAECVSRSGWVTGIGDVYMRLLDDMWHTLSMFSPQHIWFHLWALLAAPPCLWATPLLFQSSKNFIFLLLCVQSYPKVKDIQTFKCCNESPPKDPQTEGLHSCSQHLDCLDFIGSGWQRRRLAVMWP